MESHQFFHQSDLLRDGEGELTDRGAISGLTWTRKFHEKDSSCLLFCWNFPPALRTVDGPSIRDTLLFLGTVLRRHSTPFRREEARTMLSFPGITGLASSARAFSLFSTWLPPARILVGARRLATTEFRNRSFIIIYKCMIAHRA